MYELYNLTGIIRMTSPANESAESFLPLKPVVFHILLALAEHESHGYAVIHGVRNRSDGRIKLETGPFYRHLKKLMDGRLVVESERRPADDDSRRGAYYRLTSLGREVVAAETQRMASLVSFTEELGLSLKKDTV
jgi:DNA-binding PadR family transcriptional regulator